MGGGKEEKNLKKKELNQNDKPVGYPLPVPTSR